MLQSRLSSATAGKQQAPVTTFKKRRIDMSNNRRRTRMVIAAAVISLGICTTLTYALLPSTSVPPAAVPLGTLAGGTPLNVLSVDAFTREINQAHGTNAVLQHLHFAPGQSTGWH